MEAGRQTVAWSHANPGARLLHHTGQAVGGSDRSPLCRDCHLQSISVHSTKDAPDYGRCVLSVLTGGIVAASARRAERATGRGSQSPSSGNWRDSSCRVAGQEPATANPPTNDRRLGLSPSLQRRLALHRLDRRSGTKSRTPSSRHRKQVHGQSSASRARAQNPNERSNVRPPRGSTDQTTIAITEARSDPLSHAGLALTQNPNELVNSSSPERHLAKATRADGSDRASIRVAGPRSRRD